MKPEVMKYISLAERRHYMKCPDCGGYFDMRDLQDVFNHFHKSASIEADYTHSVRIGEPIEYSKRKRRNNLN